jgi:carbonic anhydrase/acetyltransferase-like protein (isoleucine patch superfamily)
MPEPMFKGHHDLFVSILTMKVDPTTYSNTMAIYQLDDLKPDVHPTAWVADNAQVMGRVTLAEDASVWFGVVIRGDTSTITLGKGSNVQDNSVLHADVGMPLVIGEGVTVGHQVMLHGCTVGNHSLMGAGALVTEGKEFPDGSMIIGSPAKAVRMLSPEQMEGLKMSAKHYVDNANRYKAGLKKLA